MSITDFCLMLLQPLLIIALGVFHEHSIRKCRNAMEVKDKLIKIQNEMIDKLRADRDKLLSVRPPQAK